MAPATRPRPHRQERLSLSAELRIRTQTLSPRLRLETQNPGHFQKLKELFRRYGDGGGGGGSPDGDDPSGDVAAAVAAAPPRFREALFRVLARYHAIGAYGFQAALNEETFEVLRTRRAETGPRGDNRCRRARR